MTAARPLPPVTAMLTVAEVAERLRVSKMSIYRALDRGEITGYRIGRLVRIPQAALDRFLTGADVRNEAGR